MNMVSRNLRFRFTLVSYNILSQTLLNDHSHLYSSCNPRDLEWPRRGHKILSELLVNQADIICLQEVESEHLRSLYRPKLANKGYDCLYKKKTGYKVDGCAIFYKSKLFQLLCHKGVEFNRTDVASLLNRDNVGIIAVLQPRIKTGSESSHLIIANTHLLFNPRRSDIKLAQLKFFLSELEQISRQSCPTYHTATSGRESSNPRCSHATILCGDLNSPPDSEVVRYILKNSIQHRASRIESNMLKNDAGVNALRSNHKEFHTQNDDEWKLAQETQSNDDDHETPRESARIVDQNNRHSDKNDDLEDYNHLLDFRSVYPTRNIEDSRYVTTFSSEIVDYIFYTSRLRLEHSDELLTEDELSYIGAIPNRHYPSDHITLRARFTLR